MKTTTIDKMIDAVPLDTRCRCGVCSDPTLSRAVARWLERRAAGEVLPSLNTMHRQLFSKVGKVGAQTVARHVSRCLGVDHRTGEKL